MDRLRLPLVAVTTGVLGYGAYKKFCPHASNTPLAVEIKHVAQELDKQTHQEHHHRSGLLSDLAQKAGTAHDKVTELVHMEEREAAALRAAGMGIRDDLHKELEAVKHHIPKTPKVQPHPSPKVPQASPKMPKLNLEPALPHDLPELSPSLSHSSSTSSVASEPSLSRQASKA